MVLPAPNNALPREDTLEHDFQRRLRIQLNARNAEVLSAIPAKLLDEGLRAQKYEHEQEWKRGYGGENLRNRGFRFRLRLIVNRTSG